MQLRGSKLEDPEISLTGLIDVVFLLLIFFMVSTTFEHQAVLKVDLPDAKNVSAPEDQPNSFELVIDQNGQFYLNDRQLIDGKPATLRAAFIEAAGEDRRNGSGFPSGTSRFACDEKRARGSIPNRGT